jgi:kynurenine formamidase
VTVSLGRPLFTEARIDVPRPAEHHMTMLNDVDIGSGSLRFAKDYIGIDYHNERHSHIDGLCHVALDGCFFNGRPATSVTAQGAGAVAGAIDALENGQLGRPVLLEVPRAPGIRWVEPGEQVSRADPEAAERGQGVRVGPGDILLVRAGHSRRLHELGPWDPPDAKAGLHPTAALFLAERCVTALGSDGNNDTAPNTTEGIAFPIHGLAINAIGIHLLDYLQFGNVVAHCEAGGRWEFFVAAAPLRLAGETGSPFNLIAIF